MKAVETLMLKLQCPDELQLLGVRPYSVQRALQLLSPHHIESPADSIPSLQEDTTGRLALLCGGVAGMKAGVCLPPAPGTLSVTQLNRY